MNGEQINEHIKDMGKTDKTKYLKELSEEERKKYKNYKNNKYQQNHQSKLTEQEKKDNNYEKARMMRELRAKDVEKYKTKNKKHNKDLYLKKKLTKEEAVSIIQIKAREYIVKNKINAIKEANEMVDNIEYNLTISPTSHKVFKNIKINIRL